MKLFIFTIFIALVLIFIGCSSEPANTNTAANTPVNAAPEPLPEIDVNAPFVPNADPKIDLLSSTKRLQSHESWSATSTNDAMPDFKTEMEFVAPDRYHIKNDLTEIIAIGSESYVKEEAGWKKVDEDIGAEIKEMQKSFNAEGMKTIREVTKTGTEKIGDKDATIYEYTVEPGPETFKRTTRVWIANDSGLPLKIIIETENAGQKQKQTTVYDYDKKINIEAPKVKEAN